MSGRIKGAVDGNARARVVAHDHRDRAIAQRMDQCDLVAHLVEGKKLYEVGIKGIVPARGAAIAAKVRRDRIVACGGQGRHHLAPAITKVRKTVQQKHERPARRARLNHVHRQAIDVGNQAHPNTGRKRVAAIGTRFGVDRLAGDLCFRLGARKPAPWRPEPTPPQADRGARDRASDDRWHGPIRRPSDRTGFPCSPPVDRLDRSYACCAPFTFV